MKRIYLVISHAYDFHLFRCIDEQYQLSRNFTVRVIINSDSTVRDTSSIVEAVKHIDASPLCLPNYILPSFGKNILRAVLLGFVYRIIIAVRVKKNSTIFIADKSRLYSLILIAHAKKVLLFQFYEDLHNSTRFKLNLLKSLLFSFELIMQGCCPIRFYKLKYSKTNIESVLPFLRKNVQKIYISPPDTVEGYFPLPLSVLDSKSDLILIFGSRFLSWGLTQKQVCSVIQFYLKLLTISPQNFVFKYLQHPLEVGDEYRFLKAHFSSRLNQVADPISSENFLFHNRTLNSCFSFGSTSSRSAYEMGFNSMVFYRSILGGDHLCSAYDSIFEGFECMHVAEQDLSPDIFTTSQRRQINSPNILPIILDSLE